MRIRWPGCLKGLRLEGVGMLKIVVEKNTALSICSALTMIVRR